MEQNIFDKFTLAANQKTKEKEYWEKKLSGDLIRSCFIYDSPGSPHQEFNTSDFKLKQELSSQLLKIANHSDPKLHIILTTISIVLLHKYSNNTDITIGMPIYKQDKTDNFINTILPLRNKVNSSESFKQLLRQVRENTIEAIENRNYPIENIIKNLNMPFQKYDFPLFDMAVLLENIHDLSYIKNKIQLNLTFSFKRNSEGIGCQLEYNQGLYRDSTIRRIASHFNCLTKKILSNPEMKISGLSLLNETERSMILNTFNATDIKFPGEKTIVELFETQVEKSPRTCAVYYEETTLTYQQLNNKANHIANSLRDKGVCTDTVVGIMMERSVDMISGIMGILKAGGAYLPIAPGSPEERITFMISDSNVELLLTDQLPGGENGNTVQIINMARFKNKSGNINNPEKNNKPGDLAYVIYTSGSTGKPKGIMVEHKNVVNLVYGLKNRIYSKYNGELNICLLAPFVFDASVQQIFASLLSGHSLYIVPNNVKNNGRQLIEYYHRHNIDISDGTPSHLRLLLEGNKEQLKDLSIRHFIIGGETLPKWIAGQLLDRISPDTVNITNVYGPTECCVDSTSYKITKANIHNYDIIPIGTPMPNEQVYILDDNMNPQAIGVPGQLCISGDGVARGYTGDHIQNRQNFCINPFIPGKRMYLTGDIARLLSDGHIEFIGRNDGQVKIRGYRIELEEIKKAILKITPQKDKNFSIPREIEKIRKLKDLKYCTKCLLSGNYPGIHFDEKGVCSICTGFAAYKDKITNYFKSAGDFKKLIKKSPEKKNSEYDCLLLFSGGKDSSYVLYRLVEMGLKVLAFTFDNGYISDTAFANIKSLTSKLEAESIIVKNEMMDQIFLDSLNRDNTVCTGCFKALTVLSTKTACEYGINTIITGLSRGQIFDTKLEGFCRQEIFEVDEIEKQLQVFKKMYHSSDDTITKLLNTSIDEGSMEKIRFIDFFRYDDATEQQVNDFLKNRDEYWQKPEDTGFCSTNCLINDAGIFIHLKNLGYHNYAAPNSWSCRLDKADRTKEFANLEFSFDTNKIEKILKKIGYFTDIPGPDQSSMRIIITINTDKEGDKYLSAYLESKAALDIDRLKKDLSGILPGYMIPAYFVKVENFPLTTNGKINLKLLPDPRKNMLLRSRYVAPQNKQENKIVDIWAEVLDFERHKIGMNTKFFDLGGDSFKIIKVTNKINKALNINLGVTDLFQHTTINSIISHINSSSLADNNSAEYDDDRANILEESLQLFGSDPGISGT